MANARRLWVVEIKMKAIKGLTLTTRWEETENTFLTKREATEWLRHYDRPGYSHRIRCYVPREPQPND